jgi:hypothetical protein
VAVMLEVEHSGGHEGLCDAEGGEVRIGEQGDLTRGENGRREGGDDGVPDGTEQGGDRGDVAGAGTLVARGMAGDDELRARSGKRLEGNEIEEPLKLDLVEEDGEEEGTYDDSGDTLQAQRGLGRMQRGKEAGDKDEDAVGDAIGDEREDHDGDCEGQQQDGARHVGHHQDSAADEQGKNSAQQAYDPEVLIRCHKSPLAGARVRSSGRERCDGAHIRICARLHAPGYGIKR